MALVVDAFGEELQVRYIGIGAVLDLCLGMKKSSEVSAILIHFGKKTIAGTLNIEPKY